MKRPWLKLETRAAPRLLGRGSPAARWAGATALLLTISAFGLVVAMDWRAAERLATLQDQWAQATAQRQPARPPAALPAQPRDLLLQWDQITARLNVAWPELFDTLERRTPDGVAVLSLEPDARNAQVAITAESRSLPELLAYARALEGDPAVAAVRLGQHDLRAQVPGQPVRLTLTLTPAPLRP